MSAAESKEAVERRTAEAFERSAWQDPRAEYRDLLRRLRGQDGAAFERAVLEYEATVVERLTDPSVDPVAAWLGYGERLAGWLGHGRTMRIDAEGRASEVEPASTAEPALLLHLPAEESAAAIVVASPRQPSAAQRAAVALLAEGRAAL